MRAIGRNAEVIIYIARWEGVAAEVGKGRGDGEDVEGAEEEEEEGLEAEM